MDDMDFNDLNELNESSEEKHPDLDTTLNALRDNDGTVNSIIYYGLSQLEDENVRRLAPLWSELKAAFRRKVLRELVEASEANFELNYSALGYYALGDDDPSVRVAAIELLWEEASTSLLHKLQEMALYDDTAEVRAAAASALGRFILAGELGDLDEAEGLKAQDTAISILNNLDEDIDVRRRALEAISNSSNEIVVDAIREAYDHPDHRMQISAVFAMGRSYEERWNDIVLQQLDSEDEEMRYEAARAAGELEIDGAVRKLTNIALGDEREIREVAIWSLGEIGSKEATRTLERLATDAKRKHDDELLEAIEDALDTASMGNNSLYLMKLDGEDD
jgi:HEAT repeat protein